MFCFVPVVLCRLIAVAIANKATNKINNQMFLWCFCVVMCVCCSRLIDLKILKSQDIPLENRSDAGLPNFRVTAAPPQPYFNGGAGPVRSNFRFRRTNRLIIGVLAAITVIMLIIAVVVSVRRSRAPNSNGNTDGNNNGGGNNPPAPSEAEIQACIRKNRLAFVPPFPGRGRDPLTPNFTAPPPILLKNVTVFVGDGTVRNAMDVLVNRGEIAQIAATGSVSNLPASTMIIDGHGRILTPGLLN